MNGPQVIAVTVIVLDGDRATHTVRGPLADGEAVDMGSAAAATAQKPAGDETLSPDVQHNRAWLRAAMAAQGFKPVAGWWWAFVPR
ncbi:D-alanyl-D-alanine dipeptidase [compost metagenome]